MQKIKQKEKCGRHSDKNAAGAALQKSVWHAQYRRKKIGKAITSGKKTNITDTSPKTKSPTKKRPTSNKTKKNVEIPRRVKPKKKQLRDTPQNKKKTLHRIFWLSRVISMGVLFRCGVCSAAPPFRGAAPARCLGSTHRRVQRRGLRECSSPMFSNKISCQTRLNRR